MIFLKEPYYIRLIIHRRYVFEMLTFFTNRIQRSYVCLWGDFLIYIILAWQCMVKIKPLWIYLIFKISKKITSRAYVQKWKSCACCAVPSYFNV